jgi:TolA-binding protein
VESQAASALKLANHYIEQNKPDLARERLEMILSKFPDTDAAKTAKQLLKTLGKS